MSANQAFFAIATMARVLGLSAAGYCAGVLAALRHAPSPMKRCSDECARSMLSPAAPMVYLEFMPSCVQKVGQSAGSGLPG
jgi:hypothetical protein